MQAFWASRAGVRSWLVLGVAAVAALAGAGLAATPAVAAPACTASATNETTARSLAHSCGHQVEVLSRRTGTTRVLDNPDGTQTLEQHIDPQWVHRPDGSWVDVDTTLHVSGTTVVPVATALPVSFSAGGSGPFATLADGTRRLALSWPTALPAPVLDGSSATYPEVLPGVDLKVTALAQGFSEVFVVKTRAAAANPALATLNLGVATTGVTLGAGPDGGLVARDDRGATVFSAPKPLMWDAGPAAPAGSAPAGSSGAQAMDVAPAAGMPKVKAMRTAISGTRLSVTPDPSFLTDPGTHFPVSLDPTFTGGKSGGAWDVIASRSDLAGSAFWERTFMSNGAADGDAGAGQTCDSSSGDSCTSTPYVVRSMFRMDTFGAAGATVISADFGITQKWSWTCSPGSNARVWLSGGISSSTTWNSRPGFDGGHIAETNGNKRVGHPFGCADPSTDSFNVTGIVQYAFSQGWPDVTLGLGAINEGDHHQWKRFDSSTAVLHIRYDHVPNTPALSDLKMGQQGQIPCGATAGAPAHVNTTNGLTLNGVLSDADAPQGDLVKASWAVSGVAAQYVPAAETAGQTSGSNHVATIPAAAFTDGATVSWQVRATDTDSGFTGGWSPSCFLVVDNAAPKVVGITSTDLALRVGLGIVPPAKPGAIVGTPAAVTFTPDPSDVGRIAGYQYGVAADVDPQPTMWIPAGPDGAAATASIVPLPATSFSEIVVAAVKADGTIGTPQSAKFKANTGAVTHVPADATGDGKADLTALSDVGGGRSVLWRWDAKPAGAAGPGLGSAIAPQGAAGIYVNGATQTAEGDFDGDGLSDVATLTQSGSNVVLTVQRSDSDQLTTTPVLATYTGWSLANVKMVAGDFDGDGRADIGAMYQTSATTWEMRVILSTSTAGAISFAPVANWHTNTGSTWTSIVFAAGDFTGDGRADLMEFLDEGNNSTGMYLHASTGSAFPPGTRIWSSGAQNWAWSASMWAVGDVNHDGVTDIAALYNLGNCDSGIYLAVIQPGGTMGPFGRVWESGANTWCWNNARIQMGDYDGDGRADVGLVYRANGPYQSQVWTASSTGTGFAAPVLRAQGGIGPVGTGSVVLDPTGATRYQFANAQTLSCAQVVGTPVVDTSRVLEEPCGRLTNQEFSVEHMGGQYVRLHPATSPSSCLDILNAATADGTPLQQQVCNGNLAQYWTVEYQGGPPSAPVVRLTNPLAGKCFDLNNALAAPGTVIWEWTCNGGTAQGWLLRPVPASSAAPRAEWQLNENGGTTASDATGAGTTVTVSGGTLGGGHLTLTGSQSGAATGGTVLDTASSFTVSAWVQTNSLTTTQTYVGQDGGGRSNFVLGLDGTSGKWTFGMAASNAATATVSRALSASAATTGTWTHLVGVYDATANTLTLYVDGTSAGTVAAPGSPWRANGYLTIGRGQTGGAASDLVNGAVDDVSVFSSALPASAVSSLFAAGAK